MALSNGIPGLDIIVTPDTPGSERLYRNIRLGTERSWGFSRVPLFVACATSLALSIFGIVLMLANVWWIENYRMQTFLLAVALFLVFLVTALVIGVATERRLIGVS